MRTPAFLAALLSGVFFLCTPFLRQASADTPADGPAGPSAPSTRPARGLEVRVVDVDGKTALAGVEIEFNTGSADRQVRTGSDGVARVELPADPRYFSFTARSAGRVPTRVAFAGRRGKAMIPDAFTLPLESGTKIGGQVVDDAGKGVGGATVVLHIRKTYAKAGATANAGADVRCDVVYESVKAGADGRWSFDRAPAEFDAVSVGAYDFQHATSGIYSMQDFQPVSALRDGSARLTLAEGTPIEGVVYGSDGKPAAHASVGVGGDRVASNVVPEFKADENGHFRFEAQPGEMVTITVKAAGQAPELKQFLAGGAPGKPGAKQEVEFRLRPAKALKGRVTDPQGKPLQGVAVYTDTWRSCRTLDVHLETDADGRFTWADAPDDTIMCDIMKVGYADQRKRPLTAGDKEVAITLRPPLKVSGTVVDAETGEPVPAFLVIHGINFGSGQATTWERRQTPAAERNGKNGKFEFEQSFPYPGYAVRIEADGYLPSESRVFTQDEGKVDLEFKLTKGRGLAGVIRRPDGTPAAAADVIVATPGQAAYILNGREIRDQGCVTTKADGQGKYSLPPQVGAFTLVVIHDGGYAEVPAEAAAKSPDVNLRAWGRIEGTALVGSNPAAKAELSVRPKEGAYDEKAPRIYHQIEATADDQGHFVFDRVKPGEAFVCRNVRVPTGGRSWMVGSAAQTTVNVEPGRTAEAKLGGTGRPIVGKVVIPPEVSKLPAWQFGMTMLATKIDFPKLPMPDDLKAGSIEQRKAWMEDFRKTDAGKAYTAAVEAAQARHRSYMFAVQPDGSFRIDDVPAGTYTVNIAIAQLAAGNTCGPGDTVASGGREVVVPEMAGGRSDEPLEIPSLTMTVLKVVNVGDAAPAFAAKTLDGKDLKLEDYRGKYLLLDFWATWCGPCVAEVPELKRAYDAGSADPRFAMLSLSLDEKPAEPAAFVKKQQIHWDQGFLGEWSQTGVPNAYGVNGIPSVWLIGPDGKVIAKELRGEAIKSAVEAALAGAPAGKK